IRLELKEAGDEIIGETTILFAFNEENVKSVALDLSGLAVYSVSDNDREATFARAGDRLLVQLAGAYQRGEQSRVRVRYHGSPKDGLFIKPNKFGDRAAFADNWPNRAHHWFPAIDHPYDKATVEFLVT